MALMAKEELRLCLTDLPYDVVAKLETMSKLADELRVMCVAMLTECMELADRHGGTEIADAAQRAGLIISGAALPIVVLGVAGNA
jgi:hypothetical protein